MNVQTDGPQFDGQQTVTAIWQTKERARVRERETEIEERERERQRLGNGNGQSKSVRLNASVSCHFSAENAKNTKRSLVYAKAIILWASVTRK